MRIRRRRRRLRCFLPSVVNFSACCGEHSPCESTRATTTAQLLDSLGIYLAKSVFSVMLAVHFELSTYGLKYRICLYKVSGTQTPALLATDCIYQATEVCCFSCSLFQASLSSLVSDVMEGAGGRYPGPPATLVLLFNALSWRVWVSAEERFECKFPAPTGAFHCETAA